MITEADIQKMTDIIVEQFHPEKIILFGSYARGDATEDSDVDLLIIAESSDPRYKRAVPIYRSLSGVEVGIDILVYTPREVQEWSQVPEAIVNKALTEGEVLYEKSA